MFTLLVILLIVLLLGGGAGYSRVGYVGFSPFAIVLLIVLALLLTGNL